MTSRPIPPDRPLRAKLRELGLLSREQEAGLPQFLIIAPEYAGVRRLAQIIQRHPGCSLPDALGTQFFSSGHQCCNLDWYIRALGNDVHLVRGEWTPSYALVPVKTIRLIHELLPQLKLVFQLRDPTVEAWHAWNASKQSSTVSGTVTEVWPWARADSLGQLRRWTSVFPAEQFFIGFDDQFHSEQGVFLKRLFAFLNVEPSLPEQRDELPPISPEVMPAGSEVIPTGEVSLLREVCRSRIEELVAFLRDSFCQNAPAQWTLPSATKPDAVEVARLANVYASAVNQEFDDVFLYRAVARDEANSRGVTPAPLVPTQAPQKADSREARFTPERLILRGDNLPRLVREGYCGFNVVAFREAFIAIPQAAGPVDLSRMSDAALDQKVNSREFLRASSLVASEQAIDEYLAPKTPGVFNRAELVKHLLRGLLTTPHGAAKRPQSAA